MNRDIKKNLCESYCSLRHLSKQELFEVLETIPILRQKAAQRIWIAYRELLTLEELILLMIFAPTHQLRAWRRFSEGISIVTKSKYEEHFFTLLLKAPRQIAERVWTKWHELGIKDDYIMRILEEIPKYAHRLWRTCKPRFSTEQLIAITTNSEKFGIRALRELIKRKSPPQVFIRIIKAHVHYTIRESALKAYFDGSERPQGEIAELLMYLSGKKKKAEIEKILKNNPNTFELFSTLYWSDRVPKGERNRKAKILVTAPDASNEIFTYIFEHYPDLAELALMRLLKNKPNVQELQRLIGSR